MERLEPTRKLALKVWWSFIWRAVLLAIAAGFAVGVVFGALSLMLRVDPQALNGVSGLLGLGIGAVVSIEVMYRILRKKFNGFEIALIRTDDE
jgi:xanthosine utilization system XapX-like protein